MFIAVDSNDVLTFIDWAVPGREYFCPVCHGKLSARRGEIRQHYFAHLPGSECSDTWDNGYDMSEWHKGWQERFPVINREVIVRLGAVVHRADVLTGKTVIEFQHSTLSTDIFNKRSTFYHGLGYKVVWLFDLTEEIENGKLDYSEDGNGIDFRWKNPRNTINRYDLDNGQIELFFQVGKEEKAIVKVKWVSEEGFSEFGAEEWFSEEAFLAYFQCTNGTCPEPIRDDISANEQYHTLKRRYNVNIDKQQERAVENVEGATLVLAIPGSGKTTTLVARIGYMVNCKDIEGKSILALTYTKSAAADMKERYTKQFGANDSVQFRTINSFADEIVKKYSDTPCLIPESRDLKRIIREVFKEFCPYDYATEGDIKFAQTTIAYVKNMMLSEEEAAALTIWGQKANYVVSRYNTKLRDGYMIDFDDQLVRAYEILKNKSEALQRYQGIYKFFCVDEAQDTSKIQYEMIKLLASETNNIFMVGDEDQSIYRFRAAYPEALMNFENEYPNPFILQLETNYRSTEEIVDLAATFISKNVHRHPKYMHASRGKGAKPELIFVDSREAQYQKILEVCKNVESETAFLYRDNACVLPVANLLLKNGIPFQIKKPDEIMFFNEHVVRDIKAFMELALDDTNGNAFLQIYGKCCIYMKRKDADGIRKKAYYEKTSIFDAAYKWLTYGYRTDGDIAIKLKNFVQPIANMTPADAIRHLMRNGYGQYLEEKGLGKGHLEILLALAFEDKTIPDFFMHLDWLKEQIAAIGGSKSKIILSTVHSSKGLEYDNVYLMDVFDGMLPGIGKGTEQDIFEQEQEERRVFYVAMTRAKNHLYFIGIADKETSFIDELFPCKGRSLDGILLDAGTDIVVRNMRTQKAYTIDIISSAAEIMVRRPIRINARQLDVETGEIIELSNSEEVEVSRHKAVWEEVVP